MTRDCDPPDDDADTPRQERARSTSGEIDRDRPRKRRAYSMSDTERALSGFRDRDTAPLEVVDEGVPERRDDEVTPSMGNLSPELQLVVDAVMSRMDRLHRQQANRVLEVEAAAVHPVAREHSSPVRRWTRDLALKAAIAAVTSAIAVMLGWVWDSYRAIDGRLDDMHDRMLLVEQRSLRNEQTLLSIAPPHIVLPVPVPMPPGLPPGKDPP